jgi:LysR family transcriptional regulator, hydrogen peroxide-inducible genes activator
MHLDQVKYFIAVCGSRNFTRAAVACGISQPSLSGAIRRLEKELGGALFDRGPPVRLAPLGDSVKPHFEAILREINEIHSIAADVSNAARIPEMANTMPHSGAAHEMANLGTDQQALSD